MLPKNLATVASSAERRLIRAVNRKLGNDPDDYLWCADQFKRQWGDHLPQARWKSLGCILSYEQASQIKRIADCPGFLHVMEFLPMQPSKVIEAFQLMNAKPQGFSWFVEQLKKGTLDKTVLVKVIREIKKYGKPLAVLREEKRQEALMDPEFGSGKNIHTGDFRQLYQMMSRPVDVFFSDPPWDKQSVPLYAEYAKLAAARLKPSGWCLAFCGVDYLDAVMRLMDQHLTYYTTYAIFYDRRLPIHYQTNSAGDWQPLLVFYRPPLTKQPQVVRCYQGAVPDTTYHEMGRPLEMVRYYLNHFSEPGDHVVDCFLGGGTTAVASKLEARLFSGTEIVPRFAAVARKRLEDTPAVAAHPEGGD